MIVARRRAIDRSYPAALWERKAAIFAPLADANEEDIELDDSIPMIN